MKKWSDHGSVAIWFGSIGIPFPTLNAYMAASTELLGVILLTLGFFTRFISIPLLVIMVVAIFTVHLIHGFAARKSGFEIPFYNMLFLAIFASFGAGKVSLDHLLFGISNKQKEHKMKKLIQLGLIIAGTAALSFTITNAKCGNPDDKVRAPLKKYQKGKCSNAKHTQKKDYNITKPASKKGRSGSK
jgi:putative oxidoreductase